VRGQRPPSILQRSRIGTAYGEGPLALESSNPAVVRVESVVNGAATLSFVGAGQATLVLENDISTAEQVVEVVPHDAFVVALDRLELCDDRLGSLEFHCLNIREPGLHVLEVSVGDERLVLPFVAVLDDWYAGYFAYQYDPAARPQGLRIEALDRRIGTSFRGVPSEQMNKRNRSAW
jgi:hypothetical protein